MIPVVKNHIPQRTIWLLAKGLEHEQVCRMNVRLTTSVGNIERHHAVPHILQRRRCQCKGLPAAGWVTQIHEVVIGSLQHSHDLERLFEAVPCSAAFSEEAAEKLSGAQSRDRRSS